ncbi:MAG: NAD-dependent epimerase/dehydratase family protein [Anaerolineae bacterium]|nr:NAD-dependent epimerase/dehydratase family protein [Anaerolineae bacterium]
MNALPRDTAPWRERVLVTGGSGFIGSALVERLLQLGADVHCLLLPSDPAPNLAHVLEHVQVHRADLADLDAVRQVVRDAQPEVVMHLAAVGVTDVRIDPALAVRVNVEGTLNLLRALDGAYRVFVNTGTCHEYGDNDPPFHEGQDPRPTLPYAITKTAVWHFCRRFHHTHGWPIVTVRPFAVYGPRQGEAAFIPSCIRAAHAGVDFRMTGGDQVRDYIYVSDVVEGFVRAARTPQAVGGTFNLCTGQGVPLHEVARAILAHMGDPVALLRGVLPYREDEIWRLVGDNTRAREILDWAPRITLADGLRRTIEAALPSHHKAERTS